MNNSDGRDSAGVPESRMARRALVAKGTIACGIARAKGGVRSESVCVRVRRVLHFERSYVGTIVVT